MAKEATLPRLGQGMETGVVVKWLKAEGDTVEKGEPLYEVETDKATQEVEAEASGVLLKILVQSGEVPVGQTVAVIGEAGETYEAAAAPAPAAASTEVVEPAVIEDNEPVAAPVAIEENEPVAAPVTSEPAQNGDRIKASPLARRIARERGIDLASLIGTGPDGRIVAEDVERPQRAAPAAAPAAPSPAPKIAAPVATGEVESVPLSTIRKTIARRLTAAWDVPVFVLTVSVDMTPANSLIERAREMNPDVRITITDLLAKVCAQALMRHPDVNVQYADDAILRFPSAHVGIAAAVPQGLVVPVIRSVERLSLAETAAQRADVIGRARENKLQQSDLEGGTFTISNLGMFGVEQFTAILNPPQAAILAVGATEERAVVVDGEIVARPTMTMSLTVDHRAVDGAPAADFLRTVKTFLEEPALAL
ncbi:MAG TPA: dihydrolipoamide acetyltransferase family protein [Gaiellaceae bacterium]|nr:dihydrolipoamide acetyltransferase family protein [Gaiellaceae bacterium]